MSIYNNTVYHKHHFIPKHAGGTDHPDNLILVTVPEHIAFHYERWVLTGNRFDRFAWNRLIGSITDKELQRELYREFCRKGREALKRKIETDSCFREKRILQLKSINLLANTKEVRLKAAVSQRKTYKLSKHQQGSKNSQYGTRWIHNIDLKISKKIKKTDKLPEGWTEGRKIKF